MSELATSSDPASMMSIIVGVVTGISTVLGAISVIFEKLSRKKKRLARELQDLQVAKMRYEIEEILKRSALDPSRYRSIEERKMSKVGDLTVTSPSARRLRITVLDFVFGFVPNILTGLLLLIVVQDSNGPYTVPLTMLVGHSAILLVLVHFFLSKIQNKAGRAALDLGIGLVLLVAIFLIAAQWVG